MNKKIEKLDPAFMGSNAGSCGASLDEVVLKINEIVDMLNDEPELRESEDERIRKAIIELLKEVGRDDTGISENVKCMIAYLEKQKEQKLHLTVSGKEVYKICPRCKSRMIRDDSKVYTSMPPQYGYECPKCGETEFDTVKYDNPEMEEQKPAEYPMTPSKCFKLVEWSNEFEETLNTFLFNFAHSPSEDCEPKEHIKEHADKILKAAYKELRARLEQDIFEAKQEGIRDGIASVKPAEWSEEDEKNLELVTDCVYEFYPDPVMKYKLKDWLKHLRPSWKPSEEQMKALKVAFRKDGDDKYRSTINSLYNDLKKL